MAILIETIWGDLIRLGQRPTHRRVSAEHPLDLYAELSESGQVGLLAVCDEEPPIAPKYESVEVEIGRRTDARWAVRVVLARTQLRPLFARLCDDIVETGKTDQLASRAGHFVLGSLARWRRLLDLGPDGLMSDTDIRGLAGELLFLNVAIPIYGTAVSVAGWNGPFDAPQDFDLPGKRFEIKAVRRGAITVRISSLDQLDTEAGEITLVVYTLQKADLDSATAFTLPSLVETTRAALASSVVVLEEFEARLRSAGYEFHEEYLTMAFSVKDISHFHVAPNFPRLSRSELPGAFAGASYDLVLAKCEDFRVSHTGV